MLVLAAIPRFSGRFRDFGLHPGWVAAGSAGYVGLLYLHCVAPRNHAFYAYLIALSVWLAVTKTTWERRSEPFPWMLIAGAVEALTWSLYPFLHWHRVPTHVLTSLFTALTALVVGTTEADRLAVLYGGFAAANLFHRVTHPGLFEGPLGLGGQGYILCDEWWEAGMWLILLCSGERSWHQLRGSRCASSPESD
jgi:hypothetical protein